MISPKWCRIAGIHAQEDGDIGAVWLALNKDSDCVHVYDACMFRREVLAVIAEGLNARGRWIPIAWTDKDISDKLLERGCNMLHEACKDTPSISEVVSRDIWERMRTGRFKVDKRIREWLDEYRTFYRKNQKVPKGTHPLMAATRHAVSQLDMAKRQRQLKDTAQFPRVAMI